MNKLKVVVIFGGKTAEHEISLISAKNIMDALDKTKYEIIPVGITKEGKWLVGQISDFLQDTDNPKSVRINQANTKPVAIIDQENHTTLVDLISGSILSNIDVVFPIIHGTNGEDGTLQGLLKLANIPFIGPSVLGSAIGMDKDVMKRLLRDAAIPIGDFLVFDLTDKDKIIFQEIEKKIGLPLFVKPANAGSSVGISKVRSEKELKQAVAEAFRFDNKILIEEAIIGDEIEIAVLGNENPMASLPGKIIPNHEFYSYEAKYVDENGASTEVPVKLPEEKIKNIQDIAIKTFKTLCCEGMARVDGFLKNDGEFIINEINTIPGFTKISMYPKLWQASGLSYPDLLDKLISLAIERFEREKEINTNSKQYRPEADQPLAGAVRIKN